MLWTNSHRADKSALPIADRHYNRQKIGSPQFVPPGRCLVFLTEAQDALWVSSAPFAEYVKHAWAGAWVNTLFRNESSYQASTLICQAVAATLYHWPEPPSLGFVSFVDPKHVKPTYRRGQAIYGYCYLKAGWSHVGFTKAGLWVWQLLPAQMPIAEAPLWRLIP
jgi:hypothetical protein